MPKLGLTMETGTIEKWHKKEGDKVESGEILFEVMTDKVSLEVEAYNSGYLKKILRREGEEVPVTEVIAYIGDRDEAAPGAATGPVESAVPETGISVKISPLARNIAINKGVDISKIKGTGPGGRIVREDVENYIESMGAEGKAGPAAPSGEAETRESVIQERIKISPLARSLAREMGIDYISQSIKGTGPGGRIVKEDILSFASSVKAADSAPAASAATAGAAATVSAAPAALSSVPSAMIPPVAARIKSTVPLRGMRKIIAERLTYSNQYIPHIIQTAVMDVTSLTALREKIKDKVFSTYGTKLTYTDFIIKACAIILAERPVVNASLQDGNHIIFEDVNVGLAVSVDAGLIVPTIYGADRLSLFDIAKKRIELVDKAKASKLVIEEISNGTFTISNLGMFGVQS